MLNNYWNRLLSQVWAVPSVDTKVSPDYWLRLWHIWIQRSEKGKCVCPGERCEEHFKKNESLFFHKKAVNKRKIFKFQLGMILYNVLREKIAREFESLRTLLEGLWDRIAAFHFNSTWFLKLCTHIILLKMNIKHCKS